MNLPEPYNVLIPNQVAYLEQELTPAQRRKEQARLDDLIVQARELIEAWRKKLDAIMQ